MRLQISEKELELIKHILAMQLPTHAKVWVFGSRTTKQVKPYSDLDLLINAGYPLSSGTMIDLAADFDESDLPYKVDLVDWHSIDEAFRELITKETVLIME